MTDYTLIRSDRRTVALQITREGTVVVRAPRKMAKRDIDAFVESKRGWIDRHLSDRPEPQNTVKLSPEEVRALADAALRDLPARLERFAPIVGVTYGRVTVRNQVTRWGSCSSKGNLNFNCLLMLCPEPVRDYVVVHELCHRLELNHSPRFWAEVERVLPGYRDCRRWLREHGGALIARL